MKKILILAIAFLLSTIIYAQQFYFINDELSLARANEIFGRCQNSLFMSYSSTYNINDIYIHGRINVGKLNLLDTKVDYVGFEFTYNVTGNNGYIKCTYIGDREHFVNIK